MCCYCNPVIAIVLGMPKKRLRPRLIQYTGFNVRHLRRADCGGNTYADREKVLSYVIGGMSFNELGSTALGERVCFFVNDGKGNFQISTSELDVLLYQESRMEACVRVKGDADETSMFVIHVPRAMHESAKYSTNDAFAYLEEAMLWVGNNLIPGGVDAISGGSVHFEATVPCVYFYADTFTRDLNGSSLLHCRVGDGYGPYLQKRHIRGPKQGKYIQSCKKLKQAQQDLREYMCELGYPVGDMEKKRYNVDFHDLTRTVNDRWLQTVIDDVVWHNTVHVNDMSVKEAYRVSSVQLGVRRIREMMAKNK